MKLKLSDREIDLEGAFPLTAGDLVAFKQLGVVSAEGKARNLGDPDTLFKLLLHLSRKADKRVTVLEIDAVPMGVLTELGRFFTVKAREAGA